MKQRRQGRLYIFSVFTKKNYLLVGAILHTSYNVFLEVREMALMTVMYL